MSNKKLSFKLGQEKNRGELYTRHSNAIENTVVSFEDGQALFSYSGINSTKYPYKPYDNTFKRKPSKDARIYIDLSNERIPISSYFSDYSSKLWDLSSGEEFTVGNYFNSIYFNNGQPNRGHGNNVIYCECLDQDVESNIPIRVSLSDGTWLYDENSLFMNEIPDGTIFIIYFCYGAVTGTKRYLQLQFSENSTDKTSIIRAYNLSENYNIPEGAFISYVYLSGDLYQINDSIATTENYGQTKLYDNFDLTATDLAATANSVHKIVNESLLFTGNKTLGGKFLIRTKQLNSVLDSNQNDAFCIYTKNTDNGYTTRLYLDSAGISSTSQENNGNEEFSSLYLNTEGGNLILGPQLLINNNTIQALIKYDEEELNDLYLNPDGGNIKTSQININPKEIESLPYENATVDNHLIVGDSTDAYIAIDTDDIQAISADYPSDLHLNFDGGIIHLGSKINIEEDGQVYIANETQSDSSDTGALIVKGGIGVAKTSYMASIYPGASRTTTYTLGSASNIWSGVYSQYNYLFGSSGNNYTQIKTEDTLSSSVTVTVPNIDGNVTISKTSDFENDGDSVKYYKIPFYTTDYKEIGVNDGFRLWQYKGSTDKADEGISTLTLGNDKPSETENNKYGAVDIYSIDSSYQSLRSAVSETRGVTYLRNYGTSGFLVATAELNTAVGGEATNGDTPVYISETGLATACTGIVVNELAQTFKGSKTFSSQMVLTTRGSIDSYNTGGTLRIGPSTITSSNSLLFNRDTIQARDKSGNGNDLYLNPNGGDILFGDYSYFSPEASSDGGNYLFINGEIETYGDIICGGSISSGGIYPMSHNQWNIGSDTVRWDNIYVSNYVSTGALQLGNTGGSPSTNKTTTIGYGTSDPSSVVSFPEIGRVYFKIIS